MTRLTEDDRTTKKTISENEVMNQFSDWEGQTCNVCGETIANDIRDMREHLLTSHDIEVEDS